MRSQPHDVYVITSADGAALYVGMSVNTERRLLQHRTKHWFPAASTATVMTYPDWDTAKRAEGQAIRTHHPKHNDQRENWAAARATGLETPAATRTVRL